MPMERHKVKKLRYLWIDLEE